MQGAAAAAPPHRRCGFKVDAKVLEARTSQRYEIFRLPEGVTSLLRKPAHENNWQRAQDLQRVVLDLAAGVEEVRDLDAEGVATLRAALMGAQSASGLLRLAHDVEIRNVVLNAGARMLTKFGPDDVTLPVLRVQLPAWSPVLLSPFGVHLQRNDQKAEPRKLQDFASTCPGGEGDGTPLNAADCVTRLLLDLGFIMWQKQCMQWQRGGKAWTTESKIAGAIRYFLKGLHVGETPVFDGICAFCGVLLHGHLNETGIGNKTNGRPVTIDGALVTQGVPENAQPPFLLRWSPDFFAEMAPDVFFYDPVSNRVGLKEAHMERAPWRVEHHHRTKTGLRLGSIVKRVSRGSSRGRRPQCIFRSGIAQARSRSMELARQQTLR